MYIVSKAMEVWNAGGDIRGYERDIRRFLRSGDEYCGANGWRRKCVYVVCHYYGLQVVCLHVKDVRYWGGGYQSRREEDVFVKVRIGSDRNWNWSLACLRSSSKETFGF